jgi:hypothetical protein
MSKDNKHSQSFYNDLIGALNEVSEWTKDQRRGQITVLSDEGILASGSFNAYETARIVDAVSPTPKTGDMKFVSEEMHLTNTIIEVRQREPFANLLTRGRPVQMLQHQGQWR